MLTLIGIALLFATGTIAYIVASIREASHSDPDANTKPAGSALGLRSRLLTDKKDEFEHRLMEIRADEVLREITEKVYADLERGPFED